MEKPRASTYWILAGEIEDPEFAAIFDCECDFLERSGLEFVSGESIYLENPLNIFVSKYSLRGDLTDLLYTDLPGLVVSNHLKKMFANIEDVQNVEYFPIILTDEFSNYEEVEVAKLHGDSLDYETIQYLNYSIANIVGLADCVNHELSELSYFSPQPENIDEFPLKVQELMQAKQIDNTIDFIRHLVFDDSKIPEDIKIFRLKDCPRILVFKEEVVEAIKKAGLTGFVFTPLEEYTDEIPDNDDDDDELEEEMEEKVPEIELTEEQKEAKARYEAQQERSRVAYDEMQERIRIRRERGEGPSLV